LASGSWWATWLNEPLAGYGYISWITVCSASSLGDVAMSIYVGNLSFDATQDQITEVFAEYGTVSRVSMPTDRETGRPRGFAFVEMESEDQETAAIDALDGAEWMGRDLKVNKARPRENNNRRSSGGGFNKRY
jgi:RNA recognition motif-containing protein